MNRTAAALIAAALVLAVAPAAEAARMVTATDTGVLTYFGDSGDSDLRLSAPLVEGSAVVVFAEVGILEGNDPSDLCMPGAGRVTCRYSGTPSINVEGGAGDDRVTVDNKVPGLYIRGQEGRDRLTGADGGETLDGGPGADEIDGGGGRDYLLGGPAADVARGGAGDDYALGDPGDGDRVDLGPGNDLFGIDNTDGTGDALDGGPGVDVLLFESEGTPATKPFATVDLASGKVSWSAFSPHPAVTDSLTGIEDAGEYDGKSGPDVLIGDDGPNVLAGGDGDDTITGGSGNDTLLGGSAFTTTGQVVSGYGGRDVIAAFDGFADRVDCGEGEDALAADQFDAPFIAGCESVDARRADPFGVAPAAPPAAAPSDLPPAAGSGGPAPARDERPPECSAPRPTVQKRASFLRRGYAFQVRCDEHARVEVTARARGLVVDAIDLDARGGTHKVAVKVPRPLRRALGTRFTVQLRFTATDRSGNRATQFTKFKVR